MEDEHLVVCELDGFPGCSLFAVFDGEEEGVWEEEE